MRKITGIDFFYVEQINGLDSAVVNEDPNEQIFSGYKQLDMLQKLSVIVNPNWTQNFNVQYSRSSNVPRYDRLTRIREGQPQYAEWYYGPQERFMISSESVFLKKRKVYDGARVNFAYQKVRESRHNRRFRSAELNHRNERVDVFSVNVDLKKELGRSEVKYGAEYIYNDVKSTAFGLNTATDNTFSISTRYPAGGSYTNSGGLYLSHKWTANERLIFSQAVRLNTNVLFADLVDTTFFPLPVQRVRQTNLSLSGGLGAIYKAGDNWRISTNLGTGFRAPNVDDVSKVFESVGGTVVVPNAELKPERIYSFDIGAEGKVNEDISMDIGTFVSYLTDVIVVDDFTLNGMDSVFYDGEQSKVRANQNKQEAYLTGLSMGVNVRFSDRMKFNFKTNYTYGRVVTDSTDAPLDHIPPIFGRGGISYSVKKLDAEFYVHYNAWKRKKDYSLKGRDNFEFATKDGMPAWITYNFRVNYELANDLRIQLAVENVTDYNYRVFASGISGPGINFIFNIRKNF